MNDKWNPSAEILAATGKSKPKPTLKGLEPDQPSPVIDEPSLAIAEVGASLIPVSDAGSVTKTMAENIARIIHLDKQIEELEQACAALAVERAAVAEALKEQFVEAEIQNVKVLGRTVFLHRSVYCNVPAENMQQIVKVLDAEGLGDVAPRMASTAKIKGLLKEDEAKWKAKFGELIKTGERYDIRNRSAS